MQGLRADAVGAARPAADAIPLPLIPLNDRDETVDSFYRYATPQELEEAVGKWLRATIQNLEEAERTAGKSPPPENTKQAASGRI